MKKINKKVDKIGKESFNINWKPLYYFDGEYLDWLNRQAVYLNLKPILIGNFKSKSIIKMSND